MPFFKFHETSAISWYRYLTFLKYSACFFQVFLYYLILLPSGVVYIFCDGYTVLRNVMLVMCNMYRVHFSLYYYL